MQKKIDEYSLPNDEELNTYDKLKIWRFFSVMSDGFLSFDS